MRWTSIGSAALLSFAAVALSAPAASAGDDSGITSFGFTASPATVAPGGTVTLTVTGCDAPAVTVTSVVFDTVTVKKGKPGKAVVDPETKTGAQYDITFECDGETGTTPLTVSSGAEGGKHDPSKPDPSKPDPSGRSHKPDKGVKAGLGGSVTGTNPSELVAGGVLIAAALGGVLHLRSRAARDRN